MKRPDVETWKSQAKAHNGNITPKMVKKLFKYVSFLEESKQEEYPVGEFNVIENEMLALAKRKLLWGDSTETPMSTTSESYVAFRFVSSSETDLFYIWKRWLLGYIDFVEHQYYEGESFGQKKIYWRIKPEVRRHKDGFEAYARLLISKRKP